MTSQHAQLQALITEMEALLGKAAPKLPWKMTGEASEQRRVIEQVLAYLKELQAAGDIPGWALTATSDADRAGAPEPDAEAAGQQVLRALLQEMQYLRAQMVQPLTQEVMALQQQRETLKNEVRQLELNRLQMAEAPGNPQLNPAWINEVVGELRSSLLDQLAPQLRSLQAQIDATPALSGFPSDPLEVSADLPQLSPQQRFEQLQRIQAQTDYMLLKLDANLRAVFESLDQSIQSYCDTLNQGLDAMHGLGQQGEFIFRTFINHLAQQFQEESATLAQQADAARARLQGRNDEVADAVAALDDRDDFDTDSMTGVVDLDGVDLDNFDVDEEEVTLFQLDEEFADLPLMTEDGTDDVDDATADEGLADRDWNDDPTVLQTESVSWAEMVEQVTTAPDDEDADNTEAYTEQIDSLYDSLFGQGDNAADATTAPDEIAPPPSVEEATLDNSLLGTDATDFDDLAAPSPPKSAAEPDAPEAIAAPVDTDVEALLSDRPDPPDADADAPIELGDLLGPDLANSLGTPASDAPGDNIINSLTELLPTTDGPSLTPFTDPLMEFDESEDTFIPAPPDENLLATDLTPGIAALDFDLNDETLGQLTSDLSDLEGQATDAIADPTVTDRATSEPATATPRSGPPSDEDDASAEGPSDDAPVTEPDSATADHESLTALDHEPAAPVDDDAESTMSRPEAEGAGDRSELDVPEPPAFQTDAIEPATAPDMEAADETIDRMAELDLDLEELLNSAADETAIAPPPDTLTDVTAPITEPPSDPAQTSPEGADGAAVTPASADDEFDDELESELETLLEAADESESVNDDDADDDADIALNSWLGIDEAPESVTDSAPEMATRDRESAQSDTPPWSPPAPPNVSPAELETSVNEFFSLMATDADETSEEFSASTPGPESEGIALDDLFADVEDETTEDPTTAERGAPRSDSDDRTTAPAAEDAAAEAINFDNLLLNEDDEPDASAASTMGDVLANFGDEVADEPSPSAADTADTAESIDLDTLFAEETDESIESIDLDPLFVEEESGDRADLPTMGEAFPDSDIGSASAPDLSSEVTLENAFGDVNVTADDATTASPEVTLDNAFGDEPESFTLDTVFDADRSDRDGAIAPAPEPAPEGDDLTLEESLRAEGITLDIDSPADSTASLTADSFDLPAEPLLPYPEAPDDDDYEVSMEGISLDLDLPDLDASTVTPTADPGPAITLEDGLFPDAETAPSVPDTSTLDRLFADDANAVEAPEGDTLEDWIELDDPPIDRASTADDTATPDSWLADLESAELPDGILPRPLEEPLDTEAEAAPSAPGASMATDAGAIDEDWSFDDLDLNLSLDPDAEVEFRDEDGDEDLFANLESSESDAPVDRAPATEQEESTPLPPTSGMRLRGSVDEGFAIAANTTDNLEAGPSLPPALSDLPTAEGAPDRPVTPQPIAATEPTPTGTSQFSIVGSEDESWQLQGWRDPTALDTAIAPLESAPASEPDRPTPILGFPAPRDWPEPDAAPRSPSETMTALFEVRGSVPEGFDLIATDDDTAAGAVMSALDALGSAVAMEPPSASVDAATLADLQRSLGRRAVTDPALIAATVLPFAASRIDLSMLPAAEDPDPPAVAAPVAAPVAAAAPMDSALELSGSVDDGYGIGGLDENAITQVIQQLEALVELPAPPMTAAAMTAAGPDAGDRPAETNADVPAPDDVPPSLAISGTAETGYTVDETDTPPSIDDLTDSPWAFDAPETDSQDDGGFWTPAREEPMATDLAAAAEDDGVEAGPLSDDEFADFFPPSETTQSEAEASAAFPREAAGDRDRADTDFPADDLDALLPDDFMANPEETETDTDLAETLADLMDDSPPSEPPSEPPEPPTASFDEFEDLFTPEELAAAEAATNPSEEDPSSAAIQFEDVDSNADIETSPDAEDSATALPLDDVDLSMEEIPPTEIENDEIFRSAFESDRDLDDALDDALDDDLDDATLEAIDRDLDEPSDDASDLDTESRLEDELDLPLAREESLPDAESLDPDLADTSTDVTADASLFASTGQLATIPDGEADTPDLDEPDASEEESEEWFLGIDLGTTGISAVLMEHVSGAAHPLCWSAPMTTAANQAPTFRLPARVSLAASADGLSSQLALGQVGLAARPQSTAEADEYLLHHLRPLLRVGLSHQTTDGTWEPLIQWTDADTVSLHQIMAGVRSLLALLRDADGETHHVEAVGLETTSLQEHLDSLQGVIVGIPTNWSDTYCLNVRECILAAGLVESPGQIFLVEDAIAAVLSGLPDPSEPPPDPNRQTQTLYQCHWQGGTVVINSGATSTEVGIVDMPQPLDTLSREDFKLRNLAYGGDALDLDIICQLLLPAERRQPRKPGDRRSSRDGWSWQATLPEVANGQWDSLQLEAIDLPQLAEPDTSARIRLRQHLESSKLGQSLLEAARYLKLILQNQNQYQLELADQSWRVLRRDLESRVLVPYIQRINQQVNALLSQSGLAAQGINQVICTGGNASFNTIAKWLRQKFPNATIIQDTYPSNRPQTCSRVAYGLVNLCRYPQVLDVPRHQYSDYFLLHEMIRVIPETPLPVEGILHMLEEQGLNTDACRSRIEAILEGHLPPGFVPDAATRDHLSRATVNSDTYRDLTAGALFTKQTRQIYMVNGRQRDRIGNHLAAIMLHKQQSLTEPLIVQLVTV